MTEKTLVALQGSIEKWEKIVARTGVDEGVRNCPLCQLFRTRHNNCNGCPVMEKADMPYCIRTPYPRFALVRNRENVLASRKYAQDELKFLKSLLPKKKISRGGK